MITEGVKIYLLTNNLLIAWLTMSTDPWKDRRSIFTYIVKLPIEDFAEKFATLICALSIFGTLLITCFFHCHFSITNLFRSQKVGSLQKR